MDNVFYPEKGSPIAEILRAKYSTPHRVYHTWARIVRMVNMYRDWVEKDILEYDLAKVYAIWFHNIEFIPARTDNELNSSYSASTILLENEVEYEIVSNVQQIIMDTVFPYKSWFDSSNYIIDLIIMDMFYEEHEKRTEQLRQEYNHLPDINWRAERKQFLHELFDRRPLLNRDQLRTAETQIRRIIHSDLQELD